MSERAGKPRGMSEAPIAFVARPDPAVLEIRINFGFLAGRDATPAELDELATALLPECGEVSIVAETRHQVSERTEAALHQVRVEIARERLPGAGRERDAATGRLVGICERWATDSAAARHAEIAEL